MSILSDNYSKIKASIGVGVDLVVVSKTHSVEKILEVYNAGARVFGENKVQELLLKQPLLPDDIQWQLIGHLQTNKVKYIVPFVSLIQSVDSLKLLKEIDKQAFKLNKTVDCLLQIYIAKEETKFGFGFEEAEAVLRSKEVKELTNIRIVGFMGMATNTVDKSQIRSEFDSLKAFFENCRQFVSNNIVFEVLSMGMSSDYKIAIEAGSTLVRVGSSIFGNR